MTDNCTYSSFASYKNKIWYITMKDNLLMEIDVLYHTLECLGKIPNTYEGGCIYRTLFYTSGCLYLIPYNAEDICKYDIEAKTFSFLDILSDYNDIAGNNKKLYGILEYNNEVILYGLNSVIFRIDLDSFEVKTYQMRVSENSDIATWFWQDGTIFHEKLILPINNKMKLTIVDLNNGDIEYVDIGNEISGIIQQRLYSENQKLYYAIADSKWHIHIIKMNSEDLTVLSHDIYALEFEEGINSNNIPFQCGFVCNDNMFLLPGKQENGYIIDLSANKCRIHNTLPTATSRLISNPKEYSYNYFDIVFVKSCMSYFSINWELKKMVFINPVNFDIQIYDIIYKEISDEKYRYVVEQIADNSTIIYEKDKYGSIQDYIKLIINAQKNNVK